MLFMMHCVQQLSVFSPQGNAAAGQSAAWRASTAVSGRLHWFVCADGICGVFQAAALRESLLLQLLPPDSHEDCNVVLEVRSSVGGEWAGDFAADLLEMYRQFAGQQGWRFQVNEVCLLGWS